MKFIGFDLGDGESAVALFASESSIEPKIIPLCGTGSILSAVGMHGSEILIGEKAYTDIPAEGLSVRFKSRFTQNTANEDITRFAKAVLYEVQNSGFPFVNTKLIVGCPADWNAAKRARYRDIIERAGFGTPMIVSESRAAFLYAKYAKTVSLNIDVLKETALVIDIGSSTLDYAYIVNGRETGIGTFGETLLGGGLLDAEIMRRAIRRSKDAEALKNVFSECKSWYSYCEIQARHLKEAYYSRLSDGDEPQLQQKITVRYDGVQKLTLMMNDREADELIHTPLPELYGQSFFDALLHSLKNAAEIVRDSRPKLVLLTGGASKMPFFRKLCASVFDDAIVVNCPEPEYSIAKGLAYAGWVDSNLESFRSTISEQMSSTRIESVVESRIDDLIKPLCDAVADVAVTEIALPVCREWVDGSIETVEEMNREISRRTDPILQSKSAQKAIRPAVEAWLSQITADLQHEIDGICDTYHIPRKQMQLHISPNTTADISLKAGDWIGLNWINYVSSIILTAVSCILCGGNGIALIAAGPAGLLAGAVIGVFVSLIGHNALNSALEKANIPLLLRRSFHPEKRICNEKVRRELSESLSNSFFKENSNLKQQICKHFGQSFAEYIQSIAQTAEIPIG